ncbi:DUF5329 family protein [Pontibacter toksunensis]|uniref:DUF5329 family protein n=1 Tax=Pontibacter toksunensis TaxID=1332631 RepID=A0ABW6BQJ2_9BACT
MKIQVMLGTVLLTSFLSAQAAPGGAANPIETVCSSTVAELTEVQKVERLIEFVRGLEGATFIRNGTEHNCQEAANHLQAKWEKHKDKIGSAKDFITELASASGMTGEAYKIKFPDGTIAETKEVLMKELERIEQQ